VVEFRDLHAVRARGTQPYWTVMRVIAEVVPISPGIVVVIVTAPAAAGRNATPPVATLVGVLALLLGRTEILAVVPDAPERLAPRSG